MKSARGCKSWIIHDTFLGTMEKSEQVENGFYFRAIWDEKVEF